MELIETNLFFVVWT